MSVSGTTNIDTTAIKTSGTQTYTGAVTISASPTLTAGSTGVDFVSTVDGADTLTITGNAAFNGLVGNGTSLTGLSVSGTTNIDTTAIKTTTGTQTYTGAVTLSASPTLTAGSTGVDFGSTINGGDALTITGDATFNGLVGNSTALTSLSVSGTSDIETTAIKTTGTQTYTGAVTLSASPTLTAGGSGVDFVSTLDGADTLTITGNAAFNGLVGNGTSLTGLSVSGTTNIDTTAIKTTSGTQTYTGAVTLSASPTLTAGSTGVDFVSTVDGVDTLTITGNAAFNGLVGNGTSLTGLSVSGTTNIDTTAIKTTSGTQTYTGAVTLSASPTLTVGSTGVDFGSTVNGGKALTITGDATFNGLVGNSTNLTSLSVSGTSDIETTGITTTGTQTYTGAVTLSASPTLTAGGSGVDFVSTVDGADTLTITGNAAFNGLVGSGTSLTGLSVSGTTNINTTAIKTTSGTQTYTGAVTLSASPTLTAGSTGVDFGSTVNGSDALTITGDATFNGLVGNSALLTSLSVSGTSDIETASIKISGTQTYTGAVTLSASPTLTAGSTGVDFGSTVDGADTLTITGNAAFNGAVGNGTSLTGLSVSGTTNIDTTAIKTTSGTQTYTGAVTLSASPTLTAGGSGVDFVSTVDGADALTITGNAAFNGLVGNGTSLTGLSVSGTTNIDTTAIKTTSGTQTYTGAVTLSASPILTAGSTGVDFGSTVNGGKVLTITGDATFNGLVGNSTNLTSLSVSGTSDIETTGITTTGTQTYTGAVTLSASPILTAGGSGVDFVSTVDGADTLTITGNAAFNGLVGIGTSLTGLSISGTTNIDTTAIKTTSGTQTYTGAVTLSASPTLTAGSTGVDFVSTVDGADTLTITGNAAFNGLVGNGTSLTGLSVSGTTNINTTAIKTTSGTQTYTGAVTISASPTLTAGSTGVDFVSTVDGAYTLTITGNAAFNGLVGNGTSLSGLSVSGTTNIDTTAIKTSGTQTYTGAVTISASPTLTAGSTGVDFVSTVDGADTLTITGNAAFNGLVGNGTSLTGLSVSGTTNINTTAIKTTSGTQTYTGAVTLSASPTLTAGSTGVDFGSTVNGGKVLTITGDATFNGLVGNSTNLTSLSVSGTSDIETTGITTTGTQTYTGAVTLSAGPTLTAGGTGVDFVSTVDGADTLTITGNAAFNGLVGNGTSLTGLSVSGTTNIDTTAIKTTSGTQTYTGAVTLSASPTLTAGSTGVDFVSTVDGVDTLTITGNAAFNGLVGNGTSLTGLSVSGTTNIDTTAIKTTSGTQTYTGAVTLSASPTLTVGSTGVDFGSTVNGGKALTITGDATFNGLVGNSTNLTSLSVSGTSDIETTGITTTGTQTYTGAVTLSASPTLTAGGTGVDFVSTVDGADTLTITGNAAFNGPVGNGTSLTGLSVSGTTSINTTAIKTTSGTQTYTGAVTLSASPTLTAGSTGVGFGSTVNGGDAVTITGDATFNGLVGNTTNLTSLSVSGTSDIDTTAIKTTGTQTYTGAVTLSASPTLTAGGSGVDFVSTVDGADTLTITGNAAFNGPVGSGTSLTGLSVSGTTNINTTAIKTASGTQTYTGAVTLSASPTLTAGSTGVDFGSTVNGGDALTITGNAAFNGLVGNSTNLTSLSVSGTSDIGTTGITTTGTQTYTGAVTLSASPVLTGDGLTFGSAVNSDSTARALTINDSGTTTFGGAVGTTALSSLTIDATGGTTNINGGAVTTSGIQTYGNPVTFGESTNLTGSSITVGSSARFTPDGHTITGSGTLNVLGTLWIDASAFGGNYAGSFSAPNLETGSTVEYLGINGTPVDVQPLTYYNLILEGGVGAYQYNFSSATATTVDGTLTINGTYGNYILLRGTSGTWTLDIPNGNQTVSYVDVANSTLLPSTNTITAGNSINSGGNTTNWIIFMDDLWTDASGLNNNWSTPANWSLDAIPASNDSVVFDGIHGSNASSTMDQSFSVYSVLMVNGYSGTLTLGGGNSLTMSANLQLASGSILAGGQSMYVGTNWTNTAGSSAFTPGGNTVYFTGSGTITSDGDHFYNLVIEPGSGNSVTIADNISVDNAFIVSSGSLNGAHSLTVTGNASIGGTIGVGAPLSSLSIGGTTNIDTTAITTSGTQTYIGAVTLSASPTLTAGSTGVDFVSTVDGADTLAITGNAAFNGLVGNGTSLTGLSVSGTANINTTAIKTASGAQTYTGAVTLSASPTLTAGSTGVDFGSTVNGADTLTIAGDAAFNGLVGNGTSLTGLMVSGTSDINTTAIKTAGGTQVYAGAVTLSAGPTLTAGASGVVFGSTVDGADALTIAGNATFDGLVGSGTSLTGLSVSGTTDINTTAIKTTSGTQTYTGAVTLSASPTLIAGSTGVDFVSTVDGADTLTIAGNAAFNGLVGSGTSLTGLMVSGTTDINTTAIKTTSGTQIYAGAVTLSASPTLTAGGTGVDFVSTVDGADALTITGNAAFNGLVGNGTSLTGLSVSGTTNIDTTAIKTASGAQTYTGAVTLSASPTLTAGSTGVDFGSTVDGADTLTITGNAAFNGPVGSGTSLTGLSVSGTTDINTTAIKTTSGTQTYTGAVTLSAGPTLTAGGSGVDFVSTVDGADTLTITGNAAFNGLVGSGTSLTGLSVSGTTNIDTTAIKTASGTQTYSGPVTLSASPTLTAGSTGVDFGSTVNGGDALTITGDATFNGLVGNSTLLTSLSVSGTSDIETASIKTSGTQTYTGAVTLSASPTLTAGGPGVDFVSTVDGADTLTITGNAAFNGLVGNGTSLTGLSVSGTTNIDTTAIKTTSGTQTYTGAVTLSASPTLTAGSTGVDFVSTVDGADTLTITGNAAFNGLVGNGTSLTGLSVSGTTSINTTAIKTASGTQTYTGAVTLHASPTLTAGSTGVNFGSTLDGADTLTIAGDAAFNGPVGNGISLTGLSVSGTTDINTTAIKTTGGTQTYTGAVTLSASPTLTAGSTGVDFGSTVDGADTLTITGDAAFNGPVGNGTSLTGLSVSGTTNINTNAIKTASGTQTYTGAVTLSASPTLTAGSTGVDFGSTVNGADALTITGDATFNGLAGNGTPLTGLSVSGTTVINTTAITTSGPQIYMGAVTLSASPTLTAGSTGVEFGSTVDGAHSLAITGDAAFDGVAGSTPLTSLSVSGTSDINTTSMTTTGTQTYTGAVTLTSSPTLTGDGITFSSTVDSDSTPRSLTIDDSGTTTFGRAVGLGAGLSTLTLASVNAIASGAITAATLNLNAGTLTLGGTLTSGNINTASGTTLDLSTFALGGSPAISNSGTIETQNTSPTPLPSGATWGGTVEYNAAGAQTIVNGTYNNLTLGGSGLKTIGTATVDGTLDMTGTATASAAATYGAGATLEYAGTGVQSTGPELTSTIPNLTLDNANGVILSISPVVSGLLDIISGKFLVTVTANAAQNKEYGTSDPVFAYTVTSGHLISGASFSGALSRVAGENVAAGPYAITLGTLTAGADYAIALVSSNFAITPAPLTITATGQDLTYGTSLGTTAFTVGSGLVAGQNVTSVTLTANGTTGGSGSYNVGNWTITPSNPTGTGGFLASNYNIAADTGSLTVTPAPLTVTATGVNKIFDASPVATVTLSDNRVPGDILTDSYVSATFSNDSVGANQPISVTGISISGRDALDYTLLNTTATAAANIYSNVMNTQLASSILSPPPGNPSFGKNYYNTFDNGAGGHFFQASGHIDLSAFDSFWTGLNNETLELIGGQYSIIGH